MTEANASAEVQHVDKNALAGTPSKQRQRLAELLVEDHRWRQQWPAPAGSFMPYHPKDGPALPAHPPELAERAHFALRVLGDGKHPSQGGFTGVVVNSIRDWFRTAARYESPDSKRITRVALSEDLRPQLLIRALSVIAEEHGRAVPPAWLDQACEPMKHRDRGKNSGPPGVRDSEAMHDGLQVALPEQHARTYERLKANQVGQLVALYAIRIVCEGLGVPGRKRMLTTLREPIIRAFDQVAKHAPADWDGKDWRGLAVTLAREVSVQLRKVGDTWQQDCNDLLPVFNPLRAFDDIHHGPVHQWLRDQAQACVQCDRVLALWPEDLAAQVKALALAARRELLDLNRAAALGWFAQAGKKPELPWMTVYPKDWLEKGPPGDDAKWPLPVQEQYRTYESEVWAIRTIDWLVCETHKDSQRTSTGCYASAEEERVLSRTKHLRREDIRSLARWMLFSFNRKVAEAAGGHIRREILRYQKTRY